jgi:hypothetical protein
VADPEFDSLLMGRGLIPGPADRALETLALMAEHRMVLIPFEDGSWAALEGWDLERDMYVEVGFPPDSKAPSYGATIGDAVRACVAKLKALDLSDRDP